MLLPNFLIDWLIGFSSPWLNLKLIGHRCTSIQRYYLQYLARLKLLVTVRTRKILSEINKLNNIKNITKKGKTLVWLKIISNFIEPTEFPLVKITNNTIASITITQDPQCRQGLDDSIHNPNMIIETIGSCDQGKQILHCIK